MYMAVNNIEWKKLMDKWKEGRGEKSSCCCTWAGEMEEAFEKVPFNDSREFTFWTGGERGKSLIGKYFWIAQKNGSSIKFKNS